MVRAVAHGRTGPSHRASSAGERDDLAHGVQDVCERLSASALSDRSHGRAFDLSNPELESLATRVLPHVRTVALLSRGKLKPESGCSSPSRRRKGQLVRKQGELRSPKHESIISLAETRGFYRQTQPAKCRPCRQESSLILGLDTSHSSLDP